MDGNLGTDFSVNRQCAHTPEDNPSWWWVNLGSDNVPISEVLLVNRFSPRKDIRQRNENFVLTLGSNFCCHCFVLYCTTYYNYLFVFCSLLLPYFIYFFCCIPLRYGKKNATKQQ